MRSPLLATMMCLMAAVSAAGQSNIRNARLQERPAGELARTFQRLETEPGPTWIAYAVPAQSPDWNACCWESSAASRASCGRCVLEDRAGKSITGGANERGAQTISLEGSATAIVLYRVEQGRLDKVRTFSDTCELDAGGRPVYWLTGVMPAASVSLLKSLVQSSGVRGGEARSRHLRSSVLLAISAHQAPEAVAALIDLARNDAEPNVRSDALFWLAQRAGQKAAGTVTDAIDNDPDTKVKERAVFALSQMPPEESVPKLIDVARTNANPRVRQQAVFWLGQSRDPRVVKFFEELLLK